MSASEPTPVTAVRRDRFVRVGVQLQPQHADFAEIRRAVVTAEELGVDVIFNWDHFYPLYGDADGRHFECWTMLGSWAEITQRAEIGALVTCNSYRNPDLLADMARTVDHASGGRLVLGIGAGWFERDYSEYGFDFATGGRRVDALGAALPRIEARWRRLNPPPLRKIPVLVGGGGERKTLRHTARHADIWHGFGDAATIERKHRILDGWCREIGRDPTEIERSAGVESGRVAAAEALYEVGTRLFTVSLGGPHYDVDRLVDLLAWRDERNAEGSVQHTGDYTR